eukprot:692815-Prymnesium_polylepis.1
MNQRCSTWTTRVPRRWPRTARAASAAATLSVVTSRCASGWRTVTLIRCVYVPTDQNPADLLTKSLE